MRGVLFLSLSLALACRDPDPVDTHDPGKCDVDGDTYASVACDGGDDCDDDDADVHPGAAELCNDRDDDCDGEQPVATEWFVDADHDGYGDASHSVEDCDAPSNDYVADDTDCDDSDPDVSPSDPERCDNTIDDDCDGTTVVGEDADGDGFFAEGCLGGDDCDDGAPEIHVGAVDVCEDGIDSDCSGSDRSCGYEGEYDLAEASATLRSDLDYYDAGRLVEAGDVTGDGNDDVFVATLYGDGGLGGGYIVPGPPHDAVLEESGFRIDSSSTTYGASRSIGLGDANGDGIDDVSFGAPYSTENGQYILFGPITADMELASAADAWLTGRPGIFCGHGSDLGDLDDDGYEDAVIGAYYDRTGGRGSGTLFVEFGPLSGHVDLETDADVEIAGANQDAYAGRMVHAGEDIDGDGLGDFAANAVCDSTGGPQAGGVYVVYGPAAIDSLADADGFLVGDGSNAYAGTAFTVGDFDGDGLADVATYDYNGGGSVAITPGPASGEIDLGAADTIIEAASSDQQLGSGLGSGDVDLDGIDELLIGAPGDSECGENWCGAAFLVFSPPLGTSEITDVARASFRGVRQSDQSGQGVAIGDLDGDGFGELIIGGPGMRRGGGVHVESLSF